MKALVMPYGGLPETFWPIKVTVDPEESKVQISLAGYASKEIFGNGSDALTHVPYTVAGTEYKAFAEALKTRPLFDVTVEYLQAKKDGPGSRMFPLVSKATVVDF